MLLTKAIPNSSKRHSDKTVMVQHYGQWQDCVPFPAPSSPHPQYFSSVRSGLHYLSQPSFLSLLPTTALAHIICLSHLVQAFVSIR